MVKKLKSQHQICSLELYFKQRQDKWPKNQLQDLRKKTGLTRSQVYKWLWDKRNQKRVLDGNKQRTKRTDQFDKHQFKDNQSLGKTSSCMKKYRKITLRSQFQEIAVSVPQEMEFCCKLIVSTDTPRWAISLLRKHGYELSKLDLAIQHSPEKPIYVSEFREVKEEEQPFRE